MKARNLHNIIYVHFFMVTYAYVAKKKGIADQLQVIKEF